MKDRAPLAVTRAPKPGTSASTVMALPCLGSGCRRTMASVSRCFSPFSRFRFGATGNLHARPMPVALTACRVQRCNGPVPTLQRESPMLSAFLARLSGNAGGARTWEMVADETLNQRVPGSSPGAPTNRFNHLTEGAMGGTSSGQLAAAVASRPSPQAYDLPFRWRIKNAVDLHDVIVEQALDLDHRAGWIWRLAPQLRLRLVHHGREAVQVADVNGEPHTIMQAGALRLRDQPDVEESLANSRVGILHQCVGRRIDPLHAGDKDEVAGPGAETPRTLRLDGAGRVECLDAVWRGCLREADT